MQPEPQRRRVGLCEGCWSVLQARLALLETAIATRDLALADLTINGLKTVTRNPCSGTSDPCLYASEAATLRGAVAWERDTRAKAAGVVR